MSDLRRWVRPVELGPFQFREAAPALTLAEQVSRMDDAALTARALELAARLREIGGQDERVTYLLGRLSGLAGEATTATPGRRAAEPERLRADPPIVCPR